MTLTKFFRSSQNIRIAADLRHYLSRLVRKAAGIILSLMYIVALVFSTLTLLNPPQFSLQLAVEQHEVCIAWVIPGGVLWEQGIRPGDRVVELDGRPPGSHDAGMWTGQRLQVQTRTGAILSADAAMSQSRQITWTLLLLSPWFFVLGLLVYIRASNHDIAFSTQALFANAAFALVLAPPAVEDHLLATVIEFVVVTMFAPCFLRFFLDFPTKRGSKRLRDAIFIPPLIVGLLGPLSIQLPALYELATMLRLLILLAYVLMGVFLILYSLVVRKDAHSGLFIVSFGTVASVLPFIVLYLIPMLFSGQPIVGPEYAIVPLILLPVSFAYAILRHNVLNIVLIQRWLVHGLIWIGLAILYTYVIFTFGTYWLPGLLFTPYLMVGIIALSVIFVGTTLQWLYNRICRLIDHMLFKDSYDYRTALQNLSLDLSTACDIDALGVGLLHTLRRLINVEFVALLLRSQKNQKDLHLQTVVGTSQPEIEKLLTELEWSSQEEPQIVSLPINQNILPIPLRVHNLVIGYICIGPKANGEPFRAIDRDLLSTLSGQIAAIIRNSQLVADLHMQVNTLDALYEQFQHAQEEERTRLAADIHDEPLQTAIHLQRQLVVAANTTMSVCPLIPLSQTLIDQLRNVCMEMRPTTLDDLGLIATLDALAQEQSDHMGVPISLDIDATVSDPSFPPNIELVLYRAAQEAVNNSLRHAHPRAINITLCQHEDLVQLLVIDDGQGFAVPDHLNSLIIQGHLGLIGMHERVERIGGQLSILSELGQGTIVQLTLPVHRSSHDSGDVGG